ncbi:MAG: response regulator, partial [Nannocystaceae bacterium]|nr:response regulator [Nannocystaceae bacterium]
MGQESIFAGKTILLVDDEALVLSSVRQGLEALDATLKVYEAVDGVAALEVLDAHPVDLVVSDVRMPRLDGVGLLTEMLNRSVAIPVVLLSAFRDSTDMAKATGMGAVSFLDKPVSYDELIGAIERALTPGHRGFMQGFSLPSLLQLMNFERKSSTLSIRSGDLVGRIFVSEGEVVDAWLGDEYGYPAFTSILRLPEPTLELAPLPDQVQRSISGPLSALLLNAIRQDDERRRSVRVDDVWEEVVEKAESEVIGKVSSHNGHNGRSSNSGRSSNNGHNGH